MAHPGQIISVNADHESKFGLSYKHAGAAMPAATGVGVVGSGLPGAMLETHATAVFD